MTGDELLEEIGVANKVNSPANFRTDAGDIFTAWRTWSNRYHRSYVHLSTIVDCPVIFPDGKDAGYTAQDTIHLRGRANDKVIEFKEIRS
jgi:hypothetical protein